MFSTNWKCYVSLLELFSNCLKSCYVSLLVVRLVFSAVAPYCLFVRLASLLNWGLGPNPNFFEIPNMELLTNAPFFFFWARARTQDGHRHRTLAQGPAPIVGPVLRPGPCNKSKTKTRNYQIDWHVHWYAIDLPVSRSGVFFGCLGFPILGRWLHHARWSQAKYRKQVK